MTQQELLRIIQSRGHSASTKGDEVLIKTCVFCANDRSNLELNAEKGVYHSWCCREKGRLQDFLADRFNYNARINVRLDEDASSGNMGELVLFGEGFRPACSIESAKKWLASRHINERDARRFNIQICLSEGHDHQNRIVFPLKSYWDGSYVGYISRDYIGGLGPRYRIEIKQKVPVGFRSPQNPFIHIVVEGIIDGIRVHQAGYNAHVLLGSGSNDRYIEWAATVRKDEEVILLLDGDEVGRNRAEALKHLTATVRQEPQVLILPETIDPGELHPETMQLFLKRRIS